MLSMLMTRPPMKIMPQQLTAEFLREEFRFLWASAGILGLKIAQMLREENLIDVNDQTAYENYAAAVDRGIAKVRVQIFVGKRRYFKF